MTRRTLLVATALTAGLSAAANAQSGATDYADFAAWKANYGVDCNADRRIDAADYNIWRANFGTAASSNSRSAELGQWKGADLNCDGRVDAADYVVWRKTLGQ